MIITIKNGGGAGAWLLLDSKDERFHKKYGDGICTTGTNFYLASVDVAKWVNNDLKEECLFELD